MNIENDIASVHSMLATVLLKNILWIFLEFLHTPHAMFSVIMRILYRNSGKTHDINTNAYTNNKTNICVAYVYMGYLLSEWIINYNMTHNNQYPNDFVILT